jgi:NADPH-dependent glutamate synthase beta subunit-like oxidoreductase
VAVIDGGNLADDRGRVSGLECLKMELGEPDKIGRHQAKKEAARCLRCYRMIMAAL